MAWQAYIALLGVWILFVAPACAAPGGARRQARVAAGLGLAGALYEGWMTFVWGPTVVGPIRIDIFLVFALLAVVYLLASARIHGAGWRRTGLVAGLVTVAACVTMAASVAQTGRDMARLDAARAEGNRLLFEAKFANAAAYEGYFGVSPAADAGAGVPVGHWEPAEPGPFTRLVVGGDGRVHYFFGCGDSECQFGPGVPLESRGDGFVAQLVWRGVGERELELAELRADVLTLRVDGTPHSVHRVPPPLLGLVREEHLVYLGAFSSTEPLRQHARVAQLWLWRGERRLYAVGVFRILVAGRSADFVRPRVLGVGIPEGDGWRFAWSEDDGPAEAIVRLLPADEGVAVEVSRLGARTPWPARALSPGAIFHDEVVELAPRSSGADWQHWFDNLLVAHFTTASIPPNH